jgi:hypothetical protein
MGAGAGVLGTEPLGVGFAVLLVGRLLVGVLGAVLVGVLGAELETDDDVVPEPEAPGVGEPEPCVLLEQSGNCAATSLDRICSPSERLRALMPFTTWPRAAGVRSSSRMSLFSTTEYKLIGPKSLLTP